MAVRFPIKNCGASLGQPRQILYGQRPVSNPRSHCRGRLERVVLAHEIIMAEMQAHSRLHILDLLAKGVCKPREAAHLHTHGQVLALNKRGRNMTALRFTGNGSACRRNHLRGGL